MDCGNLAVDPVRTGVCIGQAKWRKGLLVPEIIADLQTTVISPQTGEHYVQVVAEQLPGGLWEAWLEFVPIADDQAVLLTDTETTQSSREDLERWSAALTSVYVEGAFARATRAGGQRSLVRAYDTTIDSRTTSDPFEMLRRAGRNGLRVRLGGLTRSEMLAIIRQHDLNPGAKSLARLSDSQLVTFIVTAVEVQSERRHPAR